MPDRAASLRRGGRGILGPGVAVSIGATALLLVVCPPGLASEHSKRPESPPSQRVQGPSKVPTRLWTEFPLGNNARLADARTRVDRASARRSPPLRKAPPVLAVESDPSDTLSLPLVAAFGVFAVLAALLLVPLTWLRRGGTSDGQASREDAASEQLEARRKRWNEQLVGVLNERPADRGPTIMQEAKLTALLKIENEPSIEHVLFVPTDDGYTITSVAGEAPAVGTELSDAESGVDDLVVWKVGPSPLPDDKRRCAYLERLPASADREG
jgi:hypothetical protein